MTTIGDILLVLMTVTVTGLALWGTMVASALLFPVKSARLARTLESRTLASLLTGFFVTVPFFILTVILANVPMPLAKLVALFGFMVFVAVAAVGGSGQVRLLADRIRNTYADLPMYGALSRAAAVMVLVLNIPLVGWFLMAPLSMMAGIGAQIVDKLSPSSAPSADPGANVQ